MNPTYAPAPPKTGADTQTWALIAILACIVAAIVGFAIARQMNPGWDDVQQQSALAAREAQVAGQQAGYPAGVRRGRQETRLQQKSAVQRQTPAAYAEGWQAGFMQGRTEAIAKRGGSALDDPSAYDMPMMGAAAGTYPTESFQDVLAGTELATDASGWVPASTATSLWSTTASGSPLPASSWADTYRGGSQPVG